MSDPKATHHVGLLESGRPSMGISQMLLLPLALAACQGATQPRASSARHTVLLLATPGDPNGTNYEAFDSVLTATAWDSGILTLRAGGSTCVPVPDSVAVIEIQAVSAAVGANIWTTVYVRFAQSPNWTWSGYGQPAVAPAC